MADTAELNTSPLTPYLGGRRFEDAWATYETEGYVIFESVLSSETLEALRSELVPHMDKAGRNDFEGVKTNRVYGLLAKSPIFADLAMHPLPLAFAEAELGPSCLLSAFLAINIHPGETVQPWHTDDGYVHMPLPRRTCAVSTFWAIDDTTEENGATEIIPGSHLWGEDHEGIAALRASLDQSFQSKEAGRANTAITPLKTAMPAGSLMIAKSNLWHRGGANTSDASRLIITPQYCAGWVRQIENMMMSVPPEITASLPERVRELMGYSIHPPFIGYVDGVHPSRSLP